MFSASPHTVLPEVFILELLASIVRRKEPAVLHSLKEIVDEAAAHLLPEAVMQNAAGLSKMGFNFNVEHLGLALKLLVDSQLLLVRNRKTVAQFFAAHFHTRKTEHISVAHLRNCYYRQERKTIAEFKDLLFEWLSELKKMERSI